MSEISIKLAHNGFKILIYILFFSDAKQKPNQGWRSYGLFRYASEVTIEYVKLVGASLFLGSAADK